MKRDIIELTYWKDENDPEQYTIWEYLVFIEHRDRRNYNKICHITHIFTTLEEARKFLYWCYQQLEETTMKRINYKSFRLYYEERRLFFNIINDDKNEIEYGIVYKQKVNIGPKINLENEDEPKNHLRELCK